MLFVSRLPWFCEIMPLGRTQLTRMPGLRPRQARIEPAPRKKAQGGHLFHREGADLPRRSPGCRPWGLPSSRLPAPLCSLATSDLQTRTAAHRKWPRRANTVLSASHQAQAVSSGRRLASAEFIPAIPPGCRPCTAGPWVALWSPSNHPRWVHGVRANTLVFYTTNDSVAAAARGPQCGLLLHPACCHQWIHQHQKLSLIHI